MAEEIDPTVELTPEQYFPDLYLQDLENWILHSNLPRKIEHLRGPRSCIASTGSICGFPSNHAVFKSHAYKSFHNFAHFICVTYEMNVLNFALYAQGLNDVWKSESVPFLETHGYEYSRYFRITSDELIRYFWFGEPTRLDHLLSTKYCPFLKDFVPSEELLKKYDDYFVPRYAEQILGDAPHEFGEQLLQSILRDSDCTTFRARNLDRIKLTELEESELEQLKREGVADPLGELMERISKTAQCKNHKCRKFFTITRKWQRYCSKECFKACYRG